VLFDGLHRDIEPFARYVRTQPAAEVVDNCASADCVGVVGVRADIRIWITVTITGILAVVIREPPTTSGFVDLSAEC
jgi:hypothetical protein